MRELIQYDPDRVEDFLDKYVKATRRIRTRSRIEVLDKRIEDTPALTIGDKAEAVKRLAPRRDFTDLREELRLERLICSFSAEQLSIFKFALDYDGDYKDLEEYVFHDIDDESSQERIVDHLTKAQSPEKIGVKVLTDVDDTIYANLVEDRYPKKTFYPGVLELYEAIKQEPFELDWIPVTTLSARPNPIGGTLEEGSLQALREHTNERLRPSALSGKVRSSLLGTIETLARDKRQEARRNPDSLRALFVGTAASLLPDLDALERKIGQVKFNNFRRYAKVYPEYRFVFFGDSGQADALTAELMVTEEEVKSKVVTTFIHDLGDTARSPTFNELDQELVRKEPSAQTPGVILFRNHIQAAALAYTHCDLITPEALAKVTKAALTDFLKIEFQASNARDVLKAEYKADAEEAVKLLEKIPGQRYEDDIATIRGQLEKSY